MANLKAKLMITGVVLAFGAIPAFAQSSPVMNSATSMAQLETEMTSKQLRYKKSYDQILKLGQKMPDGSYQLQNGTVMTTDGTIVRKDGYKMTRDGTIFNADGSVYIEPGRAPTAQTRTVMKDRQKPVNTRTPQTTPAPRSATTMAPVNCPAGTTAQPNGTCMLSGDGDLDMSPQSRGSSVVQNQSMTTNSGTISRSGMITAQRMDAERAVLNSLSNDEKRLYAKMTGTEREMFMSQRLSGNMVPASGTVSGPMSSEGSVQANTSMTGQTIITPPCPAGTKMNASGTCMLTDMSSN